MLLKLAALGTLGYLGYNYYRKTSASRPAESDRATPDVSKPDVALAGGPLSEEARVVEAGRPLPAA